MLLYKYLTEDKARKWLMRHDAILLTPPKFLNDESEFKLRRVPASEEEEREMFLSFGGGNNFEGYKERVMSSSFLDGEPNYMQENLSNRFGIVSLSAKPLGHMLWERYTNHSGVVVGYPANNQTTQSNLTARFFEWGPLFRVDYDDSPERNVLAKDFSDVARNVTLKGTRWEYEAEWRFIGELKNATKHPEGSNIFYTVPAHRDKIQRVIFGRDTGSEFKRDFCQWLGETSASVEEIVLDGDPELKTHPYSPI